MRCCRSTGPAGPGRAGPAGDPHRADRRAVLRPDLPARHHQDPAAATRSTGGSAWSTGCERVRAGGTDLCSVHQGQWARERGAAGSARPRSSPPRSRLAAAEWDREQIRAGSVPRRPACAHAAAAVPPPHELVATAAAPALCESRTSAPGWPSRSRSPATGDVRSASARTWPSPRWGCARGTRHRYRRDGTPGGAALPAQLVAALRAAGSPSRS